MKKINTQLLYLEDLLKNEVIRPEEYLQRIEVAYRTDPTSFTEDEVDYIEKQFKRVDIPFQRDLEASDANLLSTMNQFVSGLAEGFTTLGWADDPDTTAEGIANKLGHLIGFAPDVIASFLSMGTYLPTAVAKRVTARGAGAVAGGLSLAGKKAKEKGLGLIVNPKTFGLQSIPMKVADTVMDNIKASFGGSSLLATEFVGKGLLTSKKFKNIGEQGAHLGIALGFSAWKDGPKAMIESGLHGAAAGALFGGIGNYVNISKLLENPATRSEGLTIVKGVANKVADTRRYEEGMQMLAKGTLGSLAQGGLARSQGAPLPEQVYEHMLGFFFGATAKSAGFLDRTRYINDLRLPSDPITDYQARKQQLYKDERFLALEKEDQAYIERHLDILTTEQQGKKFTMDTILGKQFREVAQEQGFDIGNLTPENVKEIHTQIQKNESVDVLEPIVPIEVKKESVNDKDDSKIPGPPKEVIADEFLGQVNLSLAELQEIVSTKDLNEVGAVNNNYLSTISDKVLSNNPKLDMNQVKVGVDSLARQHLEVVRQGGKADVMSFIKEIGAKYKLDQTEITSDRELVRQLGSYLQMKSQVYSRPRYELDLTTNDNAIFRVQPDVNIKGTSLGHARGKNKYNYTFGEVRVQVSDAYVVDQIYKWRGGKKERKVFNRKKILDWFNDPQKKNEFVQILNKDLLFKIREQLASRDKYIYGGAKDSGSLIIHKFAMQSTNKVLDNYMSEGSQKELIRRLKKDGYKYKDDIIEAEVVSNWIYLLRESGYIKNTDKLTTSFLEGKIKEYQKDSLYADVQKFNKYNNMAQGTNVRLIDKDYEDVTRNGSWNFLAVNDLPSKFKIGNEASESGTDAVVYQAHKSFDAVNSRQFRPEGNGFLKYVGYKAPEGGIGNILLKTGTFRATKAMNEFMEANNIDFIAYRTATKTQVGLKYNDLTYNNGKWGAKNPIETFSMRPRELYLDYGVFEQPSKIYKSPNFLKQMIDKINSGQLGDTLAKGFYKDYNALVDKSLAGKEETNIRFEEALKTGQEIKGDYSINNVSMKLLDQQLQDWGTPLGRNVVKKILENGRDISELLGEPGESYNIKEQILLSHEMADMLRLNNYDPAMMVQTPFLQYINKALHNYRTKRIQKPKSDYGFEAKLGPRDLENRTDKPINDNEFLLGENFRKLPVKVEGYPESTLEKVWKEYNSTNISSTRKEELSNALEFIMARSPNSSNGGTRVLRFAGFSGREGMEIVTTSKNDYYLGGADKDADSVIAFQGMTKNIKDTFKQYENELLVSQQKLLDIQEVRPTFKGLVKEYDPQGANDRDIQLQKLTDLTDTNMRLNIASSARMGKVNIPFVVNAYTRMQNYVELIEQNGGSLRLNRTYQDPEATFHSFRARNKGEDYQRYEQDRKEDALKLDPDMRTDSKGRHKIRPIKSEEIILSLKGTDVARELQLDHINIVNLMADSANYIMIKPSADIINAGLNRHFNFKKLDGSSINVSKAIKDGIIDYNKINREVDMFKEINDMHKMSKGNLKVEDNQTYKDVINDYLNNPYLSKSNIMYTKLAKSYNEAPNFQIDPFSYFNKQFLGLQPGQKGVESYDIIKASTPAFRERVVNWKYFNRFNMLDAYKDKYGMELRAELDLLMESPGLMYKKYQDYLKLNIGIELSQDFIQKYTERTGNEKNIETAEAILEQVIDNTYLITSFYDSGRGQLREMIGQKSYRDDKFKGLDMGLQDINLMIKRFKDKMKAKHPEDFTDIEMLIDTWLMSHPMKMFKTNEQDQAAADINKASLEINLRIKRLLEDNRTLMDDPLLRVYFKQKAKAVNQYQPQIEYIVKSIAINPANKSKFFNTYGEVLKNNMQQIVKKLKNPDKYNLDEYRFEDGELPFSLDSFVNPESLKAQQFIIDQQGNIEKNPNFKDKDKDVEKLYKDTRNEDDIFESATELLSEKLLPFDWLKHLEKPKAEWISYEMNAAMDKTIKIIKKNPDATKYYEEYFIRATRDADMVGRRLETMTVKDLELFNKYLEALPKFKELKKLPKPPNWIANTLNYAVVGRDMEAWDLTQRRLPAQAVEGKDGKVKFFDITMPTSTLEMIRLNIDKFDQLQKTQAGRIENAGKLINRNMVIDDANTVKHRMMLQEAVANTIEYNQGEFNRAPATKDNAQERIDIEKSYTESKKILDKLEKDGIQFPMQRDLGEGNKVSFDYVSPNEFVTREAKTITDLFSKIHKNFIKSRHEGLRRTLKGLKVKGLDEWKPIDIERTGYRPNDEAIIEMEKLFLDKNGLLREDRIAKVFDLLLRKNISNDRIIDEIMPSVNDHRFFIHHRKIKDILQSQLSYIDLNKPLSKKHSNIVKKEVKRLMKDFDYKVSMVGEVSGGYWARTGHTKIKANVPLLKEWQLQQIERELALITKPEDFRDMAPKLEAEILIKKMSLQEAKQVYKDYRLGNMTRTFGRDVTANQYDSLQQTMDILTNPNTESYIGNYKQANTQSRGQDYMPFYDKTYDAIDSYLTGLYKGHFTNLAGFRSETLLKRFNYVNKGKDYQKNWSNYMRNAAASMMGMSSYRSFNLHGIEAKHQPLFKAYIESGFDKKKVASGTYEKELLRDFDAAIAVSPRTQVELVKQHGNVDVAKKIINSIKIKNAKQLADQVNTTGKYGTLYHYLSDDVAVGAFSKLDKAFGGKLFGPLPTGRKERQRQIIQRVKNISDLEGKFELLSLLSHPKTAITNMIGGTTNTIADSGWEAFRLAGNTDWMLSNIFANATYRYKDPITGKVNRNKEMTDKKDISNWEESLGIYDQIFLDLVSKDTKFGKQNMREVASEFIKRVNRLRETGKYETPELAEAMRKKTHLEVLRDFKITKPIVEFGAMPMSFSERKLRGRAFRASYINMWKRLGRLGKEIPFDSPVLVNHAVKAVQASQFMYQATFRPNFANTSLGRIVTRFQPYAWNSIGRRMKLYKDADMVEFRGDLDASKKFQRQFTLDIMALALGNVFIASIFEYAMSPPMSWMQDTAALLFGDTKERDRAFFSSYPHPALAPLQIVTPPIGRFVLSPISAVLNDDWENFQKYQIATYFPFGRLYRDAMRTYDSPSMAVEWMTGLPLHQVHNMRRDQIDKEREQQALIDFQAGDTDLSESEYRDEPITKDTLIR